MKKIILIAVLISSFFTLFAQNFGQNKIQPQRIEWDKIESMHFDIYYPKGEELFGQICTLMAEEGYFYLKENFNMPIMGRIPVIFYRSHREFSTTNIIYPLLSEGTGGFTEYAKNRVVVPFDGSYLKLEKVLIHELTHAYVNAVRRNTVGKGFMNVSTRRLPFWFSEGLPEFLSVNGKDSYNNMFVYDLMLNDNVPFINQIGGYYAYRLGEAYLNYLEKAYSKKKVMDYFYAVRISKNMDEATKKVFGMDFKKLQQRWKLDIKRSNSDLITNYKLPYEVAEQRTDSEKTGVGNHTSPRFSPDGEYYVYFSNKNMRTAIYLGASITFEKDKLLLVGELDGRFEEFHFQRSTLSWFPDSERIAFVSKTSDYDQIYVLNTKTKEIEQEIPFPEFDGVYELDVSKDGTKIVFSGQKHSRNDLYIYDLEAKNIEQITDDLYFDAQPVWSPDDSKIAFTSERSLISPDSIHVFYDFEKSIFYYDVTTTETYRVTFEKSLEQQPVWTHDGNSILFISDDKGIFNSKIVDIKAGKIAEVTNVLSGVSYNDISPESEYLISSIFFNRAWNLYLFTDPILNLTYTDYQLPQKENISFNFKEFYSLDRYKLFGKRKRKFKSLIKESSKKSFKMMNREEFAKQESLIVAHNVNIDTKPTEYKDPRVSEYKPFSNFSIDHFWGGMGYSSSVGTVGEIQLNMSDLMGNHALGIQTSFKGKFEESDYVLSYLYLSNRTDYGGGVFHTTDDATYRFTWADGSHDYLKKTDTEFGVYSLIRHPINKYWRVDFENSMAYEKRSWQLWDDIKDKWYDYNEETFTNENSNTVWRIDQKDGGFIYSPSISFVHDNALYSSVGPISGWKSYLGYRQGFANKDNSYNLAYFDIRGYKLFAKRFSFASRFIAGYSGGENAREFRIDGIHGVRGYDDNYEEEDEYYEENGVNEEIVRSKKMVLNLELRYPFLDQLRVPFPFPIILGNVRGAAFIDSGIAWGDNDQKTIIEDGRLKDLKLGFGFGPRMNLGFIIVQFDIAWNSDLMSTSKPSYYFNLRPEF